MGRRPRLASLSLRSTHLYERLRVKIVRVLLFSKNSRQSAPEHSGAIVPKNCSLNTSAVIPGRAWAGAARQAQLLGASDMCGGISASRDESIHHRRHQCPQFNTPPKSLPTRL
ncbi:hypothetical protein TNCV_646881 [Trichonephila clavipes]|nr:hypothetical protein TNCV_646881 [Trichonephila clavipes]